jgi:hypothetical protein
VEETAVSIVACRPVTRWRPRNKQVLTATSPRATIEKLLETVFSARSVPRRYNRDMLEVIYKPAWELVNWSKSSVVGHSPGSNDVSTEVEESPLLRFVTGKRLAKSDLRRFSVCSSDLSSVEISDSAIITCIADVPTVAAQVRAQVKSCKICGEKMALGQALYEYFGFPYQFSFYRRLHFHRHPSSGAGTIGQLVADIPSGLSLTPPREN